MLTKFEISNVVCFLMTTAQTFKSLSCKISKNHDRAFWLATLDLYVEK